MRDADNFSGRKVKEKIYSLESRKRLQQREEYLESRQCKEADNKLYHNRQGHLKRQLPDYSANQKNQPGSLTCLCCAAPYKDTDYLLIKGSELRGCTLAFQALSLGLEV